MALTRKDETSIPSRIARATQDLRALEQQLQSLAFADSAAQVALAQLDLQAMLELKGVLDHLRDILWAYIEVLGANGDLNVGTTLQTTRMQRAADMLRNVRQSFSPGLAQTPEAAGLFDEIQSIVTDVLERQPSKPPRR